VIVLCIEACEGEDPIQLQGGGVSKASTKGGTVASGCCNAASAMPGERSPLTKIIVKLPSDMQTIMD
jgi:hypothetical protein